MIRPMKLGARSSMSRAWQPRTDWEWCGCGTACHEAFGVLRMRYSCSGAREETTVGRI